MNPFDHLKVPLQGRKLVESSAGTGKTYAIASLYVRLLLERALQTREILVVTFTEAATEDLRKRIREKLRGALLAFEGNDDKDFFLAGLLEQVPDRLRAARILNTAIQSFDEAAIFTIHGFCQKILQESAFETASLFDTELLTDQTDILQEIVEDFWRIHFYRASAGFLRYALTQRLSPGSLIDFLGKSPSNPFLTISPQPSSSPPHDLERLEDQVAKLYDQVHQVWVSSRHPIQELLVLNPGLHKGTYRDEVIKQSVSEMERYLSTGNPIGWNPALDKFCTTSLTTAVKKGFLPPAHPFFVICENLKKAHDEVTQAYDLHLMGLKSRLFQYAKDELKERKRQQNVRFFDDLLLDLYGILQSRRAGEVAQSIRERYKAALIDEFQDTDPVQYGVFDAVYNHPEAALFLIGDPKQAIYGFRGADVFAYIKASRDVSEKYTLTQNWRSSPGLIAATNAIFTRARVPFVLREIEFHLAEAADKPATGGFTWKGLPDPSPFKIWFMGRKDRQATKPINKADADDSVPGAVAGEILRLLNAGKAGVALVDGKPLSPWDIAVLVRTNREAKLVQEALQRLKIPSVLYSDESVFASREAMEVARILEAVADLSESKVKGALVTDIFGVSGTELALLNEDDAAWQNRLGSFADYRELWNEQGFMPMTRILIDKENVRGRLLSYLDGERRLTNLLHCFELLHQAGVKHSFGIEGLLKWLAERREDRKALQGEEYQVRLETDEKAVKVLTIHKSKGLEYAIVFCPFSWNISKLREEEVIFHDETDQTRIIKDIGSERREENRKRSRQEALAENVRLLYVALTRAKWRCYLVWGAFKDAGRSSLAYLLHPGADDRAGNWPDPAAKGFEELTDTQLKAELHELVRASRGVIELSELPQTQSEIYTPAEDEARSYACREFHGEIEQNWGITSFTTLVSGKRFGVDLPDRDTIMQASLHEPELNAQPGTPAPTMFNFPRGSRAGLFFHEIFQRLNFAAGIDSENQNLVREELSAYSFDALWQVPVCQMIEQVLITPLEKGNPELQLSHLARNERLHEIEFTLPLDLLTPTRLKKVFANHGAPELLPEFPERLVQLGFSPIKGLLKGYIDMIFQWKGRFYLLDWKSNFLGSQLEAYGQDSLREVMQREYYVLQCALYCLALHRYLRFRVQNYDYESHFGGAFYLFLRGINSTRGPDFGIYKDRPSRELITELSRCMTDREPYGDG